MTEPELKSLAEFAAEFLGFKKFKTNWEGHGWFASAALPVSQFSECVFIDDKIAPILAHLGKREMEKREFQYKHYWDGLNHEHLFMKPETNSIDEWDFSNKIAEGYHPNTFIALWSAIESAVNDAK